MHMDHTWYLKLCDAGMTPGEARAWIAGADALATGVEPMRTRRIDEAVEARIRQMRPPQSFTVDYSDELDMLDEWRSI